MYVLYIYIYIYILHIHIMYIQIDTLIHTYIHNMHTYVRVQAYIHGRRLE